MAPITVKGALRILKGNSMRSHSVIVSRLMRALAPMLGGNPTDWELVGLLHDLDHDLVGDDKARHGPMAAGMLAGRLPEASLRAIRVHDYRTGLRPTTILDRSLIFTDSLSRLIEDQGIRPPCTPSILLNAIREECTSKPWIGENVLVYAGREGIAIWDVVNGVELPNLTPQRPRPAPTRRAPAPRPHLKPATAKRRRRASVERRKPQTSRQLSSRR